MRWLGPPGANSSPTHLPHTRGNRHTATRWSTFGAIAFSLARSEARCAFATRRSSEQSMCRRGQSANDTSNDTYPQLHHDSKGNDGFTQQTNRVRSWCSIAQYLSSIQVNDSNITTYCTPVQETASSLFAKMSDANSNRGNARASSIEIRVPPSDYPRSNAVNYERPAPVTREKDILELMKAGNAITAPRSKLIVS